MKVGDDANVAQGWQKALFGLHDSRVGNDLIWWMVKPRAAAG